MEVLAALGSPGHPCHRPPFSEPTDRQKLGKKQGSQVTEAPWPAVPQQADRPHYYALGKGETQRDLGNELLGGLLSLRGAH